MSDRYPNAHLGSDRYTEYAIRWSDGQITSRATGRPARNLATRVIQMHGEGTLVRRVGDEPWEEVDDE